MFKKITAILLSITLLLTISSSFTGVLAATTYEAEDFEGGTVGDYVTFNNLGLTNTMLSTESTEQIYKIVEATGADGKTSKMLQMKNPVSSRASVRFPEITCTQDSGTVYTYSFDFCFDRVPAALTEYDSTSTLYLELFRDEKNGYYCNSTTTLGDDSVTVSRKPDTAAITGTVKVGKWYRAESRTNASGKLVVAIYNMNNDGTTAAAINKNGMPYTQTASGYNYNKNGTFNDLIALALNPVLADGNGFVVRIDNVERNEYKSAEDGPYITRSSIENNSRISAETTEVSVVFNQALTDTSPAKLICGSVETPLTLIPSCSTQNAYAYTLSGLSLEAGKAYKLDFSGCTNASGKAASSISFSTQSDAPVIISNSIREGAEISPIAPTATVTFDQALANDSKIVVYEEGGEEQECTLTPAGENTYTVTLPDLEDGKAYILDFTGCKNADGVACSTTVSFTTKVVRIVKLTDDFENEDLIGDNNTGYNKSDVSSSPLTSAKRANGTIYLDEGYEGSAIKMTTVADDNNNKNGLIHSLCTSEAHSPEVNPANENEYQTLVATYRINIKKPADFGTTQIITNEDTSEDEEYTTKGADINFLTYSTHGLAYNRAIARITTNSDGDLVAHAGKNAEGNEHVISGDKWYNIVWVIDGESQTFAMIDEATGEVIFKSTGEFSIPVNEDTNVTGHVIQIFNGGRTRNTASKTIVNQNQIVLVDDFTLWKIKPWENEHKLTAEVSGGETTNMIFNQPVIGAENMFVVNKVVNSENVPSSATPVFTYPDFCKMTVNYNGLRYMTDYTVDYSDLVSAGGARFLNTELATKTISFSVGKDSKDLTLIGDISYNDLKEGDVVTANIQKDTDGTACIFIAFYDSEGDIMSADSQKNIAFNAGEPTPIKFELQGDMSECRTIKVFGWDSLESITPIMSVYVEYR